MTGSRLGLQSGRRRNEWFAQRLDLGQSPEVPIRKILTGRYWLATYRSFPGPSVISSTMVVTDLFT